MQIRSIRTLILGALLSGASLLMSNCSNSSTSPNDDGLREYMSEKGYSQAELNNILAATARRSLAKEDAARQSTLDSIAYRDLFNETQLSGDSSIIEDFNKIASKAKLENSIGYYNDVELRSREAFVDALTEDKTSKEEIDSLLKNFPSRKNLFSYNYYDIQNYQHYSDKYFYGKFFKKLGLMTGDFKSKFEVLTNKIVPKEKSF